jgi:hypothetical protein
MLPYCTGLYFSICFSIFIVVLVSYFFNVEIVTSIQILFRSLYLSDMVSNICIVFIMFVICGVQTLFCIA